MIHNVSKALVCYNSIHVRITLTKKGFPLSHTLWKSEFTTGLKALTNYPEWSISKYLYVACLDNFKTIPWRNM